MHHPFNRRQFGLLAVAVALAPVVPAAAHHGWAWTDNAPFRLTGTVEQVYVGNPHVTVKVRAEDGLWHVDLAPLARTLRAGFNEDSAATGDEVVCLGFRSRDPADKTMKAARITVNGTAYDVYPNRVPNI
ncbi:DUF6152 family protein [Mesorhizobium xinjiangense]|uniref:DUF6152 family protein n=1 Tax=Mesorhizobium xinjiangense TaxID=2678685 RepID=UPI0012EDE0CD|nr:DUF6152 family protein [Mesorhizobium xinjiangense]